MNVLTKSYIETVFDSDEFACLGNTKFETRTQPASNLALELNQLVTINPLRKGGFRKDSNVKRYRTLLFEIDDMPIHEQIPVMKRIGLPYSTCVFSGNKSYHFLVVLKDELQDRTEYDAYWRAIAKALLDNNIPIDKSTKNPSRFTRAPFANRDGVVQAVQEVRGRVSLADVDSWLQTKGIDAKQFIKPATTMSNPLGINHNAGNDRRVEYVKKYFMKNDEYVQGNRHNYQHKMACMLLRTGMQPDEIRQYFISEFGEVSTGKPIEGALGQVKPGEEIYVPTKSEETQYNKHLRQQEKTQHVEQVNVNITEDLQEYAETIDRYYRIGTDYYKWMPDTQSFLKWNKTTFEQDYGAEAIPPNRYDGFQFEPDFVNPQDTVGLNQQYVNSFRKPKIYKAVDQIESASFSDFSNILKVLKYGFGDQVKKAIEYYAVSIQYPKQPLPLIAFLGEEGDGKTSIVLMSAMIIGQEYFKTASVKQFEGDYNSYLDNCLLLLINEAGNWKDGSAAMNSIKELVTDKMLDFTINGKYDKQKITKFWGKLMVTSNKENPFKDVGTGTRFWIRKCEGVAPKIEDGFWNVINKELPYFIKYLLDYPVDATRIDAKDQKFRLYFDPQEYDNRYKQEMISREVETEMFSDILDLVADHFAEHKWVQECFVDLKTLKAKLGNWKGINNQIKDTMKYGFKKDRTNLLDRPDSLNFAIKADESNIPLRKSQWYVFTREDINEHDPLTNQMNQIMGK